jgi:hypothetical protein
MILSLLIEGVNMHPDILNKPIPIPYKDWTITLNKNAEFVLCAIKFSEDCKKNEYIWITQDGKLIFDLCPDPVFGSMTIPVDLVSELIYQYKQLMGQPKLLGGSLS